VSTAVGLVVIAFAALAQAAVLPSFSIFGAQPNLVLALLVAWLIVRPRREGLLLVPAAGLMVGLLDGEPLGLAMLALAPLILMAELRDMRVVESDLIPAVAVAAAGTLVYEAIVLLTLAVTGEQLDWLASVLDVLVPAAIANALLLLPIYGLMRLASMDLRGRRPAF
jgi:rod shape-determining protein MreD